MKTGEPNPIDPRRPLHQRHGNSRETILDTSSLSEVRTLIASLRNMQIVFGMKPGLYMGNGSSRLVIPVPIAGGTSSPLQMYRFKSVQGEYITCRSWDGVTEGDTDVLIAKPYELRTTIESETIDGVTINYTYTDNVTRVATEAVEEGEGRVQTEAVTPPYVEDALIFAMDCHDNDVIGVHKIDMNLGARAWARI